MIPEEFRTKQRKKIPNYGEFREGDNPEKAEQTGSYFRVTRKTA